MAATSRGAGGAKKPANGAAWKSPAQGYGKIDAKRHLVIRVNRRKASSDVLAACSELFAILLDLLGDHQVEISVIGRIKGSAWESGLPWKKGAYSFNLKLPLSQVATAEGWKQVHDCLPKKDDCFSVSAYRGGGAHRHLVWDLHSWYSYFNQTEFQLALRHIHESRYADLRKLVVAIFSTMTARGEMLGGTGELVDNGRMAHYECTPPGWSFERYVVRELEEQAVKQGQTDAIAMPRWIMLLTDSQIHKLGGLDKLRAGASDVELQSRIARQYGPQHQLPDDGIDVQPIRGGAVVFLLPVADVVRHSHFGEHYSHHYPSVLWFCGQIQAAGLTPDMRDYSAKRIAFEVEDARRDRSEPTTASPSTYNLTADLPYLRKHPPRVLHPSCSTSQASDPPFKFAQNCTCFRLRATGGDPAVTIYGAKRKDTEGLSSPIFVGSLDKDRAALHFDERLHGHDGENSDPAPESALGKRRLSQFACPSCGSRLFLASAVFEYPDDIGEVETAKDRSRRQDFFSWFWLNARCAACAWTGEVASIECA